MCFRGLLTNPCRPFEIYGASTASYVENKCSTYHRYACALFSANSLYLHRLFQKADGEGLCSPYFQKRWLWAHPLRRIIKRVPPCTRLMASFGFAETRCWLIRAASVPLLNVSKTRWGLVGSERTGMSVGISRSDVFAPQKLAVSKCTGRYIC